MARPERETDTRARPLWPRCAAVDRDAPDRRAHGKDGPGQRHNGGHALGPVDSRLAGPIAKLLADHDIRRLDDRHRLIAGLQREVIHRLMVIDAVITTPFPISIST